MSRGNAAVLLFLAPPGFGGRANATVARRDQPLRGASRRAGRRPFEREYQGKGCGGRVVAVKKSSEEVVEHALLCT